MSDQPLRDAMHAPIADASSDAAAERERWRRVREIVARVCDSSPDERRQRLHELQESSDPLDRRAAALIALEPVASGFLESPPAPDATPAPAPPVYQPGDTIGPYRIVELLGEGGMGQVYLADDTRLLRQVAVKVVRDDSSRPSLLREARMAARLHHDAIVAIFDVVEAGDRLHIVMERVDGRTLAADMRRRRLSPAEAGACVRQILDAVGHAHTEGVIHCDLKPANVFVLPDGHVKVLDFGLARTAVPSTHSESLALAGTPRYLAPERLLGTPPSARTDIYSVGVMLFDLLAEPGDSPTSPDVLRAHRRGPMHAALLAVAARAMDPDPAKRYGSAAEMQSALDDALQAGARTGAPIRRNRARVAAAATALILMAAAAGWYVASPRGGATPPVVAVDMSALGGDPLAGHVAAALEQLVRRSLTGASNLVVVRPPAVGAEPLSEAGATHVLVGTVQRANAGVEVTLALRTLDGTVLASETARASLGDPQMFATVIMNSTDDVLRRAGIHVPRAAVDVEDIRRALSVDAQAFEEYAQAREYLRTPEVSGSTDHAIGLLSRALERDPTFVLAHASLAEAYWQNYQTTRDQVWTDRARGAALEALRLNPDDPAVRYTLALIYRGMGRVEDALSEVSKAIALEPTSDDMYRLRGRLLADAGRVDEALDDLATARTLRPGYWDNHRTTGLVLYERARYDEAVPHLRRVAELRPGNASAYQTLGTALHAAGRVSEALDAYQKALSIAPSANTYSNIAKLHFDNGRYDEARTAYEESVRLRPKEPLTHRNLGDTLSKLKQTTRARGAYETAIALAESLLAVNPFNLDALSLQAVCHAKLGNGDAAVQLASKVLATERLPPVWRYRTGVALVLAGEQEQGVTEIVRAVTEGYSKTEVRADEDLARVDDPRLRAVLDGESR